MQNNTTVIGEPSSKFIIKRQAFIGLYPRLKFFCGLLMASVLITDYGYAAKSSKAHEKALRYSKALKLGKKAFQAQRFKEARDLFRRHLKQYKRDYDSWNYLAASYYHLGIPRRALRYFKYVYKKTSIKSFNLLYRGLSYKLLKNNNKAIKMFKRSLDFHDEYSSWAMFELAVLHYHARNDKEASKWGKRYLTIYPKGVHASKARQMLDNLELGRYLPDLVGIEAPNLSRAKFDHHPLSLFPAPHFWYLQIGSEAFDLIGKRPDSRRKLKQHRNQVFGILANFGLGIGPFRSDYFSFWGGYFYYQKWLTNFGRITTYLDEPSDLSYIPFRPDLLERTHRLATSTTFKVNKNFNLGLYGNFNIKRMGSNLADPVGKSGLQGTIPISTSMLLLPWVGVSYFEYFRNFFFLYLEKTIDDSSVHFSNTTFGFTGSELANLFVSMGGRQVVDFKQYDTALVMDFFFIPYVFNDYWLDFDRIGGTVKLGTTAIPRLSIDGRFGYFQDNYHTEVLKLGRCEHVIGEDHETDSSDKIDIKVCDRVDNAMLFEFTTSFNLSAMTRFEAHVIHLINSNESLQEYERRETKFQFFLTFAFPSTKKTLNYVNKFSDTVYSIGREDYGYIR